MKASFRFTLFLLATAIVAQGRFEQIWSFQQLFDEADVVLIGSVERATKRIGTKARLEGESTVFDDVVTKFRKRALLKGDYEALTWDFQHFWFSDDTKVLINAPSFKQFTELNEVYLIFLKKNSTGELVPVSGQEQVTSSFIAIQEDSAMMAESLLRTTTKVEQDAADQEPARRESNAR